MQDKEQAWTKTPETHSTNSSSEVSCLVSFSLDESESFIAKKSKR